MAEAYVVCTNPRSGSTLLCKGLAATGRAGAPAEFFDHRPEVAEYWMNRYGINEAYSESSEAVRIEEGIAAAYTEWASGREKAGAFARLFQKIKDIIASIGNALRGLIRAR